MEQYRGGYSQVKSVLGLWQSSKKKSIMQLESQLVNHANFRKTWIKNDEKVGTCCSGIIKSWENPFKKSETIVLLLLQIETPPFRKDISIQNDRESFVR